MTMRVLVICHNDPRLHPGGTEIVAHDMFLELARTEGVEAYFLACVDRVHRGRHPGTALQAMGRSAREFLLWTAGYDRFSHSQIDSHGVVPELSELLQTLRPDVVHLHHFLLFGLDLLALIRRLLPKTRIVLTLHDYSLICAQDGLMLTPDGALCHRATPDACARCFPKVSSNAFKMRETFIQAHLDLVDHLVAPSEFLRQRVVDWGAAAERITVVRNGRHLPPAVPPRALQAGERRNRFAVFGNIAPRKGQLLALAAARLLVEQGERDFSLTLFGAPLFQPDAFVASLQSAVENLAGIAVLTGEYRPDDTPQLMTAVDWVVVPSLWWENAPLVIDEASHHRRPVIVSDLGGMAESVSSDWGMLFERGNTAALARAMRQAMAEGTWEALHDHQPVARDAAALADGMMALYAGPEVAAHRADRSKGKVRQSAEETYAAC